MQNKILTIYLLLFYGWSAPAFEELMVMCSLLKK